MPHCLHQWGDQPRCRLRVGGRQTNREDRPPLLDHGSLETAPARNTGRERVEAQKFSAFAIAWTWAGVRKLRKPMLPRLVLIAVWI